MAAQSDLRAAILRCALGTAAADATNWGVLCTPASEVVSTYLAQATPEQRTLAHVRALQGAPDAWMCRGPAYPFVFGRVATNGLLTAAQHAVTNACVVQLNASADKDRGMAACGGSAAEGTPLWHACRAYACVSTLRAEAGKAPMEGCLACLTASVHLRLGGFAPDAELARRLAMAHLREHLGQSAFALSLQARDNLDAALLHNSRASDAYRPTQDYLQALEESCESKLGAISATEPGPAHTAAVCAQLKVPELQFLDGPDA